MGGKVKCASCGEVLHSTSRHNFVICRCPQETFVDGGFDYMRVGFISDKPTIIEHEHRPTKGRVARSVFVGVLAGLGFALGAMSAAPVASPETSVIPVYATLMDAGSMSQTEVEQHSPLAVDSARVENVAQPAVAPPVSVEAIIRSAAAEFGVDPNVMLRVAMCESSMRPDVVGDHGAAVGLFQFHLWRWWHNAPALGYTADLRANPVAASRVAAYAFANGQKGAWTCR